MEIDYSLFKDKKENELKEGIKKNNYKSIKQENKLKIYTFICIILLFLILLYISVKDNSNIESYTKSKETIILLNKNRSITKNSKWNYLEKFNSIFELYQFYNFVGSIVNISYYVESFLKANITTDIFDLDNYIKIKNYIGLDGNLTKIVENGILILTLYFGPGDIIQIIFEKEFFLKMLNKPKRFCFKTAQFLLLSAIFYFQNIIDYETIISYAYSYYKYIFDSDK